MIAIQKIGKSFMGALDYNERKLNNPNKNKRAELLFSNFSSADLNIIKEEIKWLRSLRPNLNNYVYHTSLNFLKDELLTLSNEKLLEIAHDYLEGMGFDNNQYMVFRHHDADHPHIHLLANRICFDGSVVSDSNNYSRSEQLVRDIESRYNLIPVEQSSVISEERNNGVAKDRNSKGTIDLSIDGTSDLYNNLSLDHYSKGSTEPYIDGDINQPNKSSTERYINEPRDQRNLPSIAQGNKLSKDQSSSRAYYQRNANQRRAPKKNEIEMALRTGMPSYKMLLQEKLTLILKSENLSMQDFIQQCELNEIHLLFNQATTGRVSGITYFMRGFKAKGQALGKRFKWAEILKNLNYEQNRDSEAIGKANGRTTERYGEFTKPDQGISNGAGERDVEPVSGQRNNLKDAGSYQATTGGTRSEGEPSQQDNHYSLDHDINRAFPTAYPTDNGADWTIEITDDIDDEAILGRNRRREKKARQNRR